MTTTNKTVLLSLLAAILIYNAVTFAVYASNDAAIWYARQRGVFYQKSVEDYNNFKMELFSKKNLSQEDLEALHQVERRLGTEWRSGDAWVTQQRLDFAIPWLSRSRAVIEFGLPVAVVAIAGWFLGSHLWLSISKLAG